MVSASWIPSYSFNFILPEENQYELYAVYIYMILNSHLYRNMGSFKLWKIPWTNLPAWFPQAGCHTAPTMTVLCYLLRNKEIMIMHTHTHTQKGIEAKSMFQRGRPLFTLCEGELTPPGHFQLTSHNISSTPS